MMSGKYIFEIYAKYHIRMKIKNDNNYMPYIIILIQRISPVYNTTRTRVFSGLALAVAAEARNQRTTEEVR